LSQAPGYPKARIAAPGAIYRSDSRFKPAAPVRHNVVCFGVNTDKTTTVHLQKKLHQDGTAYLPPSIFHGRPILRVAMCNWPNAKAVIEKTFAAMQKLVA